MPVEQIRHHLPDLKIAMEPQVLEDYGRDWTRFYQPRPAAVAFPETVDQVQALVRLANQLDFKLVPSGGRTGLSGGAVAANEEVVVSFDRMNQVISFDPVDRTVRVQAGIITQQVHEFAEQHDLMYPVDFAAKGSSQIGGNLATNAGGIKVLRYGLSRDWVRGLKVVTGKGDMLTLNQGLIKNATGYDLRHLFVGSEGTLGFIVEATLGLCDPPPSQSVMVLGAEAMEHVMDIFAHARSALTLSAFEFFSDLALSKVLDRHGLRRPFDTRCPFYVLLEFDCPSDAELELAMNVFESCAEAGWLADGVISQSDSQAQDLWALRERISESISHETPYKNDIAVKVSQVPAFLTRLDEIVGQRYPDFEVVWFGHIGDGNLHLNILKPSDLSVDEFAAACEQVNESVFGLVAELGGSISAEHGVGLLKRDYLKHTRSELEMDYMRGMKQVFDPNGVMNPGKLL